MHAHTRRGFLERTLGAAFTGAALLEQAMLRAARARAQATSALPALFDIEKVAEGVYAALARPAALVNCNAAIFENADDLLIVDTHSKSSAAVTLVSQIRRQLTTKPVRYIVNTHFHYDHSQGNPTYKRIAPRADILSSETTRRLLAEMGAGRARDSVDGCEKTIEDYKQKLGQARTPEEKGFYQRMISELRAYISELRNYQPELPNVTLDRDLIIHDKAHDLHLAFRGRGHTAGDVVVYCPQKQVLATGDLLHGFAPYLRDGYPLEWPRTLLHLTEFDFQYVIGGHGGVQHSRERLYQMGTYIEELTEIVVRGRAAGRPVAELQKTIRPSTLKSLAGGYGQFIAENLFKYTPVAPGARREEVLEEAVASNTADIYATLDRE